MRGVVHKFKVASASVDWITSTAPTSAGGRNLWWLGERILRTDHLEGERASRWHANGYHGWLGNGVALGERPDGVILRFSGEKARDEWQHCVGAAVNVSRLDLAVDTHPNSPTTALARELYRDSGHIPSRNGRKPKRSLIVNSDGGETVYIGSRVSENFGRVYDKGIESGTRPAGRWWRWEVELKGDTAKAAAFDLATREDPPLAIACHVATWFRDRTGHSFPALATDSLCKCDRAPTTSDAKLRWLSRAVRPTIQELIETVGASRVLFALGLAPQSAVSPVTSFQAEEVA